MNEGPLIRSATPADLPALLTLEAGFASDRITPRAMRRLLQRPSAQMRVIDGESPPNTLAAASILLTRRGSRVARLYSLVVAPSARGQGLGDALVDDAMHLARLGDCDRLSLEVAESNTAARRLYARHGFSEAKRLPGYYADGGDGLRLVLALD
ncbi:MAG: N-acetyltransferase [Abyssibacter sp.]|uniref:GNAT family N-acetyltransferase n=1 Tax=Abyssibacter sp. TaxID=2320200 RepID=UPI00321BA0E2